MLMHGVGVPRVVFWHASGSSNCCLLTSQFPVEMNPCWPMKSELGGRVYSNIVGESRIYTGPPPTPPPSPPPPPPLRDPGYRRHARHDGGGEGS
eukprot:5666702-Pyramimonas_sp.AAC.1